MNGTNENLPELQTRLGKNKERKNKNRERKIERKTKEENNRRN